MGQKIRGHGNGHDSSTVGEGYGQQGDGDGRKEDGHGDDGDGHESSTVSQRYKV
jgi:hypothetical protein